MKLANRRALSLLISIISCLILFSAINVSASGNGTLSLTASIGWAGDTVTVSGTEFSVSSVDLKWDNSTNLASNIHIYDDGTFSQSITIPDSSAGIHNISVWSDSMLSEIEFILMKVVSSVEDGTYVYEYPILPTVSPSLRDVAVDNLGNIWFTEYSGNKLGKLNTSTGIITEYNFPSSNSGPEKLAVDTSNNIWITEFTGNRIAKFNQTSETFTEYYLPRPDLQPYDIVIDSSGIIWVSEFSSYSICGFNPFTELFTEYSVSDRPRLLLIDHNGIIWFTSQDNRKFGKLISENGTYNLLEISGGGFMHPPGMTIDSLGSIWIESNDAGPPWLIRFNTSDESHSSYPLSGSGFTYTGISSITVDKSDNVIFSSQQGKIVKFSPLSYNVTSYPISYAEGRGLTLDNDGNIWFVESPLYDSAGRIGVLTNFTTSLRIKVQNAEGTPLTGVTVTIDGTNVVEEGSGFYSLSGLRLGTYTASVQKSGYNGTTTTVTLDKFIDPNRLTFSIQEFVVVVDSSVSDARCDVDSPQSVSFHVSLEDGSEITEGTIYVNSTGYALNSTGWVSLSVTLPSVGKQTWIVTGVNCSSITNYSQTISNPSIIWDRVVVQGYSVSDSRPTIGENTTIDINLVYDYDDTEVTDGEVHLNGLSASYQPLTVSNTIMIGEGENIEPRDVGVNPSSNKIYVANSHSNTVSVIDGLTDTIISTIATGNYPYYIGINSITNRIYVVNGNSHTVSVIDGFTDTVIATIPVGDGPIGIGVNTYTNRIYVPNNNDGTVSVIDSSTNTVVDTISLGGWPNGGVVVNPNLNKIYVPFSNKLAVIDGATNSVLVNITVGYGTIGGQIIQNLDLIFFACYNDNQVYVINSTTDTVITTISVGSLDSYPDVDYQPTTNRIYVTNFGDDTISVIDVETNKVISTVPVGDGPTGVGINKNTKKIYVANGQYMANSISVILDIGPGGWRGHDSESVIVQNIYDTVAASGNAHGITQVDQNSQSAQVVWDQMEIVSVGFSDSRVSVGDDVEIRYTLRYDYDDVAFTGDNGSVTISGSPASYDAVNGWWERTFAQSSSVTSTNYDENDITVTDAVYGLTTIEDDVGANLDIDRIMVYWEELSDSRVNLGNDIEWRVRAVLEYDDHALGSGDTLSCSWGPLSWDETNEWWKITRSEDIVSGVTIGGWSGSEATHSITAITENITETTGIWDRIVVQGYSVSDTRANIKDNVTIEVTLVYDFDDSPVTDGTVNVTHNLADTEPDVEWYKTFGGSGNEESYSVQQTSDGGYIVAGSTDSYGVGERDVFLIKINSTGYETWNKTYGGTSGDYSYSVQQTIDEGYIIGGITSSFGAGGIDAYLIKTDPDGNEIWSKTYGGPNNDYIWFVQQTQDEGYILAGQTESLLGNYWDMYLVKTDFEGNEEWNKTYGGPPIEWANSVRQVDDGGYILVGAGWSSGSDDNVLLVKTDSMGNQIWNRTYGGSNGDWGYSVQQTTDGGYILSGVTNSFGSGGSEPNDIYLIKTDSIGNEIWSNFFGGAGTDTSRYVQQTIDGGYIVSGYTTSFGAGQLDGYLVKTDSDGNEIWNKTVGGIEWDTAFSVQQTNDGGYIASGYTSSFGAGSFDIYLIKFVPRIPLTHKGDGDWRFIESSDYVRFRAYDTIAVSGNRYDIAQVDQNSQSAQVVWDQMEIVSVGFSDSRVSVGDDVEVRYTLRYDYDDVAFTGDNGSVTISGSPASYDAVNGWWERTFAQSSSVTSTNYDERDIAVSDTDYGITAIGDHVGANVVTDRIMVYWEELNDSRVNLGDSIEWHVKAVLEYDDHVLGSEDTVTANTGSMSWDSENNWFDVSRVESSVGDYIFQVSSASENTYGISTEVSNVSHSVGVWDRIVVYWEALNDSRVDVGDSIEWRMKAVLEYDNHVLGSGDSLSSSWGALSWDETNEWWEIVHSENTVIGITIGDWSGSESSHGITTVAENITETTGIWDQMEIIDGGIISTELDLQTKHVLWVKVVYNYDNNSLTGLNGSIFFNASACIWNNSRYELMIIQEETGTRTYLVSGIKDYTYGLTTFTDFVGPLTVERSGEWSAPLHVNLGESYSDVIFGVSENATRWFDDDYDDVIPPTPPSGIVSYIWHPENPTTPMDQRKLSKSILPVFYPSTWELRVIPIGISGECTITWDSTVLLSIPENNSVMLETPTGDVNMRIKDSYMWTVEEGVTYSFSIIVSPQAIISLELITGWNMVSLQVTPFSPSVSSVLNEVSFYQVVTWTGSGYIPVSTFEPGRGYWVLVLEDVIVEVRGMPLDQVSLTLNRGWNMIGGPNGVVDADDVFPGFYQLVTWDGYGYQIASSFEPGKGYWALVLDDTSIQLPPT